jgi:hypothetical protein
VARRSAQPSTHGRPASADGTLIAPLFAPRACGFLHDSMPTFARWIAASALLVACSSGASKQRPSDANVDLAPGVDVAPEVDVAPGVDVAPEVERDLGVNAPGETSEAPPRDADVKPDSAASDVGSDRASGQILCERDIKLSGAGGPAGVGGPVDANGDTPNTCTIGVSYCERTVGKTGNLAFSANCRSVPATCTTDPSCACLTANLAPFFAGCTCADSAGVGLVTCQQP